MLAFLNKDSICSSCRELNFYPETPARLLFDCSGNIKKNHVKSTTSFLSMCPLLAGQFITVLKKELETVETPDIKFMSKPSPKIA
jgi:hypothetical protein